MWRAKGRPFGTAAGVRKSVCEADERGDRGQVDDGAASAVGEHLLHPSLQTVEDALDVDLVQPAGGVAPCVCSVCRAACVVRAVHWCERRATLPRGTYPVQGCPTRAALFRAVYLSISASVACSTVPTAPMPALFTRTSHRRPSVQIASKHALTRFATVTSHTWPVHFQPLRLHPSTAVLIAGAARSRMWTSAPAAPKTSAIARPIPLAPPVTMAVLPESEKGIAAASRPGRAVVALFGGTFGFGVLLSRVRSCQVGGKSGGGGGGGGGRGAEKLQNPAVAPIPG